MGLDWMQPDAAGVAGVAAELARIGRQGGVDLLHLNLPSQAVGIPDDVPVVAMSHSCVPTWWAAVRGEPLPRGLPLATEGDGGGTASRRCGRDAEPQPCGRPGARLRAAAWPDRPAQRPTAGAGARAVVGRATAGRARRRPLVGRSEERRHPRSCRGPGLLAGRNGRAPHGTGRCSNRSPARNIVGCAASARPACAHAAGRDLCVAIPLRTVRAGGAGSGGERRCPDPVRHPYLSRALARRRPVRATRIGRKRGSRRSTCSRATRTAASHSQALPATGPACFTPERQLEGLLGIYDAALQRMH